MKHTDSRVDERVKEEARKIISEVNDDTSSS